MQVLRHRTIRDDSRRITADRRSLPRLDADDLARCRELAVIVGALVRYLLNVRERTASVLPRVLAAAGGFNDDDRTARFEQETGARVLIDAFLAIEQAFDFEDMVFNDDDYNATRGD